jgi:hypothetical protein
MEVHHHPHVEKKNFKEYFLEFLMIFLAVTMAFIGENMRELLCDVKYKWKFSQLLCYADVPDNRQTSISICIKLLAPYNNKNE